MSAIAIIPARGGSKGIPRKNVLPVAGKPMIGWTIEAARAAERIDRVVVSTDDPEIAVLSRRFGAEVVERPAEISGDIASSESAVLHVLDTLREREGYKPDITVFLQCTSPLTAALDIDGTVNAMLDQNADTALAVTDFHYFVWKQTENDAVGINHDKSVRLMRQQREPEYIETGAVYVMRTQGFIQSKHRFFGRTALWVTPAERRWEVDDPDDMVVVDAKLRLAERGHTLDALPEYPRALVLDFDGVITDNRVTVLEDGREAVVCNRGDGMGIAQAHKAGIEVIVISKERNPVVTARCKKLMVECLQGIDDKKNKLSDWLDDRGIDPQHVVYLGNDVNDVECMEMVGCGVAVADAHESAKYVARIVLATAGGAGAVRELTDLILKRLEQRASS